MMKTKLKAATLVVIIAISILGLIGIAIPALTPEMPPGLKVGEEEAASIVVVSKNDHKAIRFLPRTHVTKVAFAPQKNCEDPASANAYNVTYQAIGFFGLVLESKAENICHLFGYDSR